jgi:ATP-dependent DNA helicase RecG
VTEKKLHQQSVRYIKGVGAVREKQLNRLGIQTAEDLILFFPRRYEDRRGLTPLAKLKPETTVSLLVRVVAVEKRQTSRKGFVIIQGLMTDGQDFLRAVWFNRKGLERLLTPGKEVALYGPIDWKYGHLQITNPEFEIIEEGESPESIGQVVPIYPLTAGLHQRWFRKLIRFCLDNSPFIFDPLPDFLRLKHAFPPLYDAILEMHYPQGRESWKKARDRLAYQELFVLQTGMALRRGERSRLAEKAPMLPESGRLKERFLKEIFPYPLTEAQKKVSLEISQDMALNIPMHRLLQGDVGSGKTAVAVLALLQTVEGGYQGAFMAPTEILAQQHYYRLHSFLEPLGVSVVLLIGSLKNRARELTLQKISTGEAHIVVGTHALFSDPVTFSNLGFAVIDEQHRFGVLQKNALRAKGANDGQAPHILVMTATPIPRTLTLSVYGDLSVSVIDEMPPGRTPIQTRWLKKKDEGRLWPFIRERCSAREKIYWVCPLIDESETLSVASVTERYEYLKKIFPDLNVALLHGQLPSSEKETIIRGFARGHLDLIVSTTVIEVGVDVPQATVMVIEDADRFGLSQLHQLRGRVGRGGDQSYCVLLSNPTTREGVERLKVMCATTDGFKIAEADLRLRGPGEVCGVRQHGITDFRVADLLKDRSLLDMARKDAFNLVECDPRLSEEQELLDYVLRTVGKNLELAGIA